MRKYKTHYVDKSYNETACGRQYYTYSENLLKVTRKKADVNCLVCKGRLDRFDAEMAVVTKTGVLAQNV